jgi:hypothetical protein
MTVERSCFVSKVPAGGRGGIAANLHLWLPASRKLADTDR